VPSRLARRAEPGRFVHRLQQSAGNQAAAKWLRGRGIQASLTVGPSDDAYERDADRVADQVLRMPSAPAVQQVQPAGARVGSQLVIPSEAAGRSTWRREISSSLV
jgi:hypothetical protein